MNDDCSFSRFGFIVQTYRQTDRQNHTHTDGANRLTLATVVGVRVSN